MPEFLSTTLGSLPFRALARPVMRGRATVFLLHRERCDRDQISGHALHEVRANLRALRDVGLRFCSVRELVEHARAHGGALPPDSVAFTMDDGYADQARLARVFLDEGVPVTIFLITGLLDGLLWPWDDRVTYAVRHSPHAVGRVALPTGEWRHPLEDAESRRLAARDLRNRLKSVPHDQLESLLPVMFRELGVDVPAAPPSAYEPMSWDEARRLERDGVEFGPHTVTHRIVSRLEPGAVREEIATSWQRVRDELQRPLDVLAWPTGRPGDYSVRDQRIARDLGLSAGMATGDDYLSLGAGASPDDFFALRRFSMPTSCSQTLRYATWVERAWQLLRAPFRTG